MGDRNQFDVQLLWRSVPKFVRQNGSLSAAGSVNGHCSNDQSLEVSEVESQHSSQIEGKQKGTI